MGRSGFRGFLRDILLIYVCFRLIGVWLFGSEFNWHLGMMVIILLLSAFWFMLERIGIMG